ncbi:siderophore synthetase component [Vreelandella songnenensis]|uniref:Siderophore synthetase component n=1 Tax=Vreelandella songnenensis TaxID=1176243 RepID=A0A2T0V8W9_9GAMM|nr:IucA/IucC family protein [Halomonas songnenensis]PRY66613.1 siderophore synthetase component [Halomonas songnenensis]
MKPLDARHYSQQMIMQFLIDGLLVEGLFDTLDVQWINPAQASELLTQLPTFDRYRNDVSKRLWMWQQDEQHSVVMLLRPGITQAWEKVPETCVMLLNQENHQGRALDPEEITRRLFCAITPHEQSLDQGQMVFLQALLDSLWQAESSVKHQVKTQALSSLSTSRHFTVMEQWASLMDRPYHPTAKAKQGLCEVEYQAYMAEFNEPIQLCWVAIRTRWMLTGAGVNQKSPVHWLAGDKYAKALEQEMEAKGLVHTHTAIPVHPWQHEHALPRWLKESFDAGDCVALSSVTEPWLATSSLRSLAPTTASPHFLKLPMAIHSLGASRYLPAVKMVNGDLSAQLLEQARQLDGRLDERLYLCDESKWWAYMPEEATLFDEAPRHLSAMVRSYPSVLLEDPSVRLVPMATLGTPLPAGEHHVFDDWLAQRGLEVGAEAVKRLFEELCDCFFEINLRMLRLGMLAEVHGQNAVLVFKQGQCHGLLLRDHDSLRITVERLEQHGMQDPCYRIKPGHSNTLYHDSLEALLFWLQTLAIQVNLRAIIDNLAHYYSLSQRELWQVMATCLESQIGGLPFEQHDREMLRKQLFGREQWPYKRLIGPIIERAGGPGSMPFGTSATCNPFRRVDAHAVDIKEEALTEN